MNILLIYGGESTEHEVSVVSARNVYAALDKEKHTIAIGMIDKQGSWWQVDEIVDERPADAMALRPQLGEQSFTAGDTVIKPDVMFAVLHGTNGEDGSVQGLAQLLHIPIVGCDMTASAIAMSKRHAKQIARSAGISVVPFISHHRADEMVSYDALSELFKSSLFVKPNSLGSSVGAHTVHSQAELESALADAHQYDAVALIEAGLDHPRELEVAVLGNYDNIRTSDVAEIMPEGEFYSYESKYDSSSTSDVRVPADLTEGMRLRIKTLAHQLYVLFGCSGLSRIDFFLVGDELYFNEINTIPGFTNISVYPKAWEHAGITYPELVEELIQLAAQKG